MKKLLSVIFLVLLLGACSLFNRMPEKMPDDFDFSVQFGVNKNNEINTYDGTVTKDLIEDGKVTANITFSNEEKEFIYEMMKEINIIENKKLTPSFLKQNCFQEPHEDDRWKITMNGETYTYDISGVYCEPSEDAKELIELRNEIFRIVKEKQAYQELPEAKGGYD